jgi:putative transposase
MKRYPSDITEDQWEIIHGFYAGQYNKQGRPPSKQLREIWNGIMYMLRAGCSWRMLPKDFPAWRTVYNHLQMLKVSGKLEKIMQALHQQAREARGRESSPSVAIVDSQSVKSRSPKKSGQGIRQG